MTEKLWSKWSDMNFWIKKPVQRETEEQDLYVRWFSSSWLVSGGLNGCLTGLRVSQWFLWQRLSMIRIIWTWGCLPQAHLSLKTQVYHHVSRTLVNVLSDSWRLVKRAKCSRRAIIHFQLMSFLHFMQHEAEFLTLWTRYKFIIQLDL